MPDTHMGVFDQLANWTVESSDPHERHLWVYDHQSKKITWKKREVYSYWQNSETARLQVIFKEMGDVLPDDLAAQSKDEFQQLVELRRRVNRSHEGFLKAHQSFFGWIYQLLFAYSLKGYFDELTHKLETCLSASLVNLDLSKLSPSEIQAIARMIEEKGLVPRLDIDWEALTLEQFQAAYALRPLTSALNLEELDQEKITHILDLDPNQINEFSAEEIEANIVKFEPRFFAHLDSLKAASIVLSDLDIDVVIEILKRVGPYSVDLDFLDLSFMTSEDLAALLIENSSVLQCFTPETVATNLASIPLKFYKDLSDKQLDALEYAQMSGEQFMHLPKHSHVKDKHLKELDLNHFTAADISDVFQYHSSLIQKLSAQTVADNLSKLDGNFLKSLSSTQVETIDFGQVTPEQLMHLPTRYIKPQQWLNVDLSKWSTPTLAKLVEENPSLIKHFSPKTVAANLARIAPRYYYQLTAAHLAEIDYLLLNDVQKEAFSKFDMEKMKHYPKAQRSSHYYPLGSGRFAKDYFADFFGGSGPSSPSKNSAFTAFFGFADKTWWDQYLKPYGSVGGTPRLQKSQPSIPISEKLKGYRHNLDSACAAIAKKNKVNDQDLYENIRKKCLTKKSDLIADPKLIFVDEAKKFNPSKLRDYYKKTALVFHPDKNQDNLDEANELFKLVSEAYKFLDDANR